jgi:hypothetical protein
MRAGRAISVVGVAAALVSACAHEPSVARAYAGRVVDGRFIEPQAYAAFLRGAIANASGDTKGALEAFDEAASIDSKSAEIWTCIADARCRANSSDAQSDTDFARALALDATYARAWAGKARCALARGDTTGARAAAERATELDPTADGSNVILAGTAPSPGDAVTRDALVALSLTARDQLVAWDALAIWAHTNGDVALWGRALTEIARIAPVRRDDVARAAEELAGAGEIWQARAVAAAAANGDEQPLGSGHPLAARLALDEAIARGDLSAVSERATRVRLPLDEAAGRALLAGNRSLALGLAAKVARAEPTALGARLVAAASGGGDLLGVANEARVGGAEASAAAFVAFGIALERATSPARARIALAGLAHRAILAGDDGVVRPAVELAARGALSIDALSPDGVVELAALRGDGLAGGLSAMDARSLDVRHEYLALAMTHPEAARAKELAGRLRNAGGDRVVAAASALVQIATGAPIAAAAARVLLSRDAADPLLAVAALRLAEKTGDRDVALRARAALTAFGGGFPGKPE